MKNLHRNSDREMKTLHVRHATKEAAASEVAFDSDGEPR